MDRESRRMLRYLLHSDLLAEGHCSYPVFYEHYCDFSSLPEQRVMACLRHLTARGFVRPFTDNRGMQVGFELEHKAYHYKYFEWEEMRGLLFRSLLVPVTVSGLAGVITYLLTCAAAMSQQSP